MNLILKLCCISLFAVLISASYKRISPEMVILIAIAVLLSFLRAGIDIVTTSADKLQNVLAEFPYLTQSCKPLIKYSCVTIICHLCSALCKDSGQSAIALGIDYLGSFASLIFVSPLLLSLLDILNQLL